LATTAALPVIWWGFFDTLGADRGGVHEADRTYKIWISAQLPLAAGVAVGESMDGPTSPAADRQAAPSDWAVPRRDRLHVG